MKATVTVNSIRYEDVVIKALPILDSAAQNMPGALGMITAAIAGLPMEVINSALAAIPTDQKNEIFAALTAEYKEKILATLGNRLQNRLGLTIGDFSVDSDLWITVHIQRIDYPRLMDWLFPILRNKLHQKVGEHALLGSLLSKVSASDANVLINHIRDDRKDAFLADIVNRNGSKVAAEIEKLLYEQYGIEVSIEMLTLTP